VVQTKQADATTLGTDDYDECGESTANGWSSAQQTDIVEGIDSGSRIDLTGKGAGDWFTFSLNATGKSWIAKSGETKPSGVTAGDTHLGLRLGA
jgi:hypothetical protein